ncbi:MAG TPA: SIS domain-containing protein [Stellaceae bacterium]|jgi:D-sedoheptulose 7-phosphate isomerase|nr:SIS domain-containing protein [Stellaceae bacterium]
MSNAARLASLYPFLAGTRQDAETLDATLLTSIGAKARDGRDTSERFFAEEGPKLLAAARTLADMYENGGRLYTMGNGGSSCDAAHVAVEFLHPVTAGRPALPAVNLTADTAMLSAIGNDLGFEHAFVRPLLAQARKGDAVIGISTSGSAANVLAAFDTARNIGMATIALTGGDGGKMRVSASVDHCLTVPSDSIHRIQECHVAAYHILWDLVHTLLADRRGSAA